MIGQKSPVELPERAAVKTIFPAPAKRSANCTASGTAATSICSKTARLRRAQRSSCGVRAAMTPSSSTRRQTELGPPRGRCLHNPNYVKLYPASPARWRLYIILVMHTPEGRQTFGRKRKRNRRAGSMEQRSVKW